MPIRDYLSTSGGKRFGRTHVGRGLSETRQIPGVAASEDAATSLRRNNCFDDVAYTAGLTARQVDSWQRGSTPNTPAALSGNEREG